MESSSTGEFLLGVEEYLTQTGNLDQANQVHTLARAFMGDNPKESCSRAFLQDFSAAVSKADQPLADLMHKTVTVTDQNQYHRAVLHYLATLDNFSVEQKNLMFKTLKAESIVDVLRSFIIFLINAYEVEISLKDFLFKSTKIEQPEDLLKDLLNYIVRQSFVEKPLKDLIHKIVKSTDAVAIHTPLANYVATFEHSSNLSVLIYNLTKSQSVEESLKDLLKFVVEQNKDNFNQQLIDIIYKIIKSNNENESVRHLILFCNNTGNKELDDFIFKSFKSESNFENYKVLLRYAGVISNTDRNLSDLSLAIARALETASFDETFIKAYMAKLDRQYQSDKLFRGINSCLKNNMIHRSVINDAFSRSQLRSKFWLVEELSKIRTTFENVAVLAGWFGQLKNIYSHKLSYKKMRIVDIDAVSCEASDLIFNLSNLEDHKVKSVRADINNLTLHANGYEWTVENFRELTSYTEKFLPDLIINTSAEHMTEEWFHQIRFKQLESNPIVVIQSNNLFDILDHINCVHSTDHMLKKFPMKKVLYVGELQLKGYKRVMLIGRP